MTTRLANTAQGVPVRALAPWSAVRHRPVAGVAVVLALLILVVPEKTLATQLLVFGLFAMSFNILLGYAGLLSFGHSTFFGLGAYGTGIALVEVYELDFD